eukprot:PLAT3362.7.p1 GENE.PLAT3362.7~~PLAT3362.7.p1  ORF type:complete len:587 (+),score=213.10 PLAT3362.7:477-2237(+)
MRPGCPHSIALAGLLSRAAWMMEADSTSPKGVHNTALLLWLAAAITGAVDASLCQTSSWALDLGDTPMCNACGVVFQLLAVCATFTPAALAVRYQQKKDRVAPALWAVAISSVRMDTARLTVQPPPPPRPAIVHDLGTILDMEELNEGSCGTLALPSVIYDSDDEYSGPPDASSSFVIKTAGDSERTSSVPSYLSTSAGAEDDDDDPPTRDALSSLRSLGTITSTGSSRSSLVFAVDKVMAEQATFAVKHKGMAAVTLLLPLALMATPAKLLGLPSPAPLFYAMLSLAAVLGIVDRLRGEADSRSRCVAHGICLTATAVWLGNTLNLGLQAVSALRAVLGNAPSLFVYSVYLSCVPAVVDMLADSFFRSKQLAEKYSFFAKLYCDIFYSMAFLGSTVTYNWTLPTMIAVTVVNNALQTTPLGHVAWLTLRTWTSSGSLPSAHSLLTALANSWATLEHQNMSKLMTAGVLPAILFIDPLLPGSRIVTRSLGEDKLGGEQLVFTVLLVLQVVLYWVNRFATRAWARRLLSAVRSSRTPIVPALFSFGLPAVIEADDKHWALNVRPLMAGLLFVVVDSVHAVTAAATSL